LNRCTISPEYDNETLDRFKTALRSHPLFARSRLDITLSKEWGEAAELAGSRAFRYTLFENKEPAAIFQATLRRRLVISDLTAGSTIGNGLAAVPGLDPQIVDWFVTQALRRQGFSRCRIFLPDEFSVSGLTTRPHYTTLIDLRPPFERLLANMEHEARKSVARAKRSGVVVQISDSDRSLEEAYKMVSETQERKLLLLPPMAYHRSLHRCFGTNDNSIVALGYIGRDCVSALHLLGYDQKFHIWQGGSTQLGYKSNATSLVIVESMRWAREQGYLIYDLGGTHPSDPVYAGIHMFKMSFGGALWTNAVWTSQKPYIGLIKPLYIQMAKLGMFLGKGIGRHQTTPPERSDSA